MSHLGRTIPALAATALTLASCGGGGDDPTATTSAADRDAARIRFQQCMRQNGVDVAPSTSQGSGSGPSTRIEGDGDKLRDAAQKCAKYREEAFGEITDEQRQEFQDAFAKFSSCMRKQGIELPAPPAAGGGSGAGEVRRQRIDASPKARAAMEACRKNLPEGSDQGGGRVLIGPGGGAGGAGR